MSALEVFDIVQTLGITFCLVFTIPLALFVYFKLLFYRPFSENYTFKLIVLNGITQLLACLSYLILYQLVSYPILEPFYLSIQERGLVTPLTTIYVFFNGLALHTLLCIALNRMKTIMFNARQNNDSVFFFVSVSTSILLTLPSILDTVNFARLSYITITIGNSSVMIPNAVGNNELLKSASFIIRLVISLATLVANIYLAFLITKQRNYIDIADRQKFNGEKGLVITSIVSFIFYMLYFANNLFAHYSHVVFCGYAQWLFLGLNSVTPFWSLILFTPSVRLMAFGRRMETTVTTILSLNQPNNRF